MARDVPVGESQVGQLFPLGSGGDLGESRADGGQAPGAAAAFDRGHRGLLGDAFAGSHEPAPVSRSS